MNWLTMALVLNALINARVAVLKIQDNEDRIKAGVLKRQDTDFSWDWWGVFALVAWVFVSPLVSAVWILKKIMFPRGIKSKFAREQEKRAAEKKARKAELERRHLMEDQLREVLEWAPGSIVAKEQPQEMAIGWQAAADVFDAAVEKVRRNAGMPWHASASSRRSA